MGEDEAVLMAWEDDGGGVESVRLSVSVRSAAASLQAGYFTAASLMAWESGR